MEVIKDNLTDVDPNAEILKQIADKEAECLKTIHTRHCILQKIPIYIGDVSRYQPDKKLRPNYWEYWLNWNKAGQYFLMSRDVVIEGGEVKLNIAFNKELAREGE